MKKTSLKRKSSIRSKSVLKRSAFVKSAGKKPKKKDMLKNNAQSLSKLGQKNPIWKGDAAKEQALRAWARRHYPQKKDTCEICKIEPAYDLANKSKKYKRDLTDWIYLCRTCHMNNDGRMAKIIKLGEKIKERNKKKPKSLKVLKDRAWRAFSLWIRNRDNWTCFTCGRQSYGRSMHGGHMIPKSVGGSSLYFHELNVHAQCYLCNIHHSGMGSIYASRFIEKYGIEKFNELHRIAKQEIKKWTKEEVLEIALKYESLVTTYS